MDNNKPKEIDLFKLLSDRHAIEAAVTFHLLPDDLREEAAKKIMHLFSQAYPGFTYNQRS